MTNKKYEKEYIESILKELSPPNNKSVSELSVREGISPNTIYGWIRKARTQGIIIPNSNKNRIKKYRSEDKLKIIMETYSMNEEELSRYCREKGLYVSDIKLWKKGIEDSLDDGAVSSKELEKILTDEKKKVKELEKELNRKEKALAETAALLVLRKKANAIWGDPEEE